MHTTWKNPRFSDDEKKTPTRFALFLSRLGRRNTATAPTTQRKAKVVKTCLVVFQQPTKDGPVIYRTYLNGKHHTDFKDVEDLLCFFLVYEVFPPIKYFIRPTLKKSYADVPDTLLMLEYEMWLLELPAFNKEATCPPSTLRNRKL